MGAVSTAEVTDEPSGISVIVHVDSCELPLRSRERATTPPYPPSRWEVVCRGHCLLTHLPCARVFVKIPVGASERAQETSGYIQAASLAFALAGCLFREEALR